jgi:glycosyltransferase 2 family protein
MQNLIGHWEALIKKRGFQIFMALFKVVVSGALITWLLVKFDLKQSATVFSGIKWYYLLAGVLMLILSQIINASRLKLLLSAQNVNIPYLYSLSITFIGLFANNFLPGSVGGDILKVGALIRAGADKTVTTLSVVTDRVMNLAAVILLLPTLLVLPVLLPARQPLLLASIVATGLMMVLSLIAVVWTMERLSERLRQRESGILQKVGLLFKTIIYRFNAWKTQPSIVLSALGLSIISVLCVIVANYIASQSTDLRIDFIQMIAVSVIAYFIALVPVSFNGLGLQEVSFVYLLAGLGAAEEQSLAVALLVRFFYVAASLIGGLIAIFPLRGPLSTDQPI